MRPAKLRSSGAGQVLSHYNAKNTSIGVNSSLNIFWSRHPSFLRTKVAVHVIAGAQSSSGFKHPLFCQRDGPKAANNHRLSWPSNHSFPFPFSPLSDHLQPRLHLGPSHNNNPTPKSTFAQTPANWNKLYNTRFFPQLAPGVSPPYISSSQHLQAHLPTLMKLIFKNLKKEIVEFDGQATDSVCASVA